jgi:Spy/CpxP family protein refolding chaperone
MEEIMKRLATFLLFSLVSAAPATAGPHSEEFKGHRKQMMDELKLSPEQQAEFRQQIKDKFETSGPEREKLQNLREELDQLIEQEKFNESAVRAKVKEMSEIQAELMVKRAKVRHEMQSKLTPEQRARAKELRGKFKEGMKRRRAEGWKKFGNEFDDE